MATQITRGIKISVEGQYHPEQSKPERNQYVFGYQVEIENQSSHTVQLLRRHWYIFDACAVRREVEGEGVIGEQPILKPGEIHRYSSWCPLISGIGTMHGNFTMLRVTDDSEFKVAVPKFSLAAPVLMN